jgi:uncharacterized protein YndB with AHSA1/START domain
MEGDTKMRRPKTRAVEVEIEIAAPAAAVWRALTEAEGLTNWFPLEAKVVPGRGGSIRSSWRGAYEGTATIEVWEPNHRLRLVQPAPDWGGEAADGALIAQDFVLEGRGGTTHLRLVHSGFGKSADWDQMYDGVLRGWKFELRGLRHYLEVHPDATREVAWSRVEHGLSIEASWQRVRERLALRGDRVGALASIEAPGGERWSGTLEISTPPHDLAMLVETVNDGYLRLRLDRSFVAPGRNEVNLFVSTYGLEPGRTARIEREWTALLTELLA